MSNPSASDSSTEDRRFERWIATLLRTGVYSSLILLFFAAVLNWVTGQASLSRMDLSVLLAGEGTLHAAPPVNLAEFFYGFSSLQSMHFVQAAVLVLILLPGLRVAFMMGSFFRQRDFIFGFLSMFVLFVMSIGTIFRILE